MLSYYNARFYTCFAPPAVYLFDGVSVSLFGLSQVPMGITWTLLWSFPVYMTFERVCECVQTPKGFLRVQKATKNKFEWNILSNMRYLINAIEHQIVQIWYIICFVIADVHHMN